MSKTFVEMSRILLLGISLFVIAGCELDIGIKQTNETVGGGDGGDQTPQSCGNVASGATESRTRYEAASVVAPASCQAELQVRVCNDGVFSAFNGSFTSATCKVEDAPIVQPPVVVIPKSCGSVASGDSQTRIRFQAESVTAPASCVSETQTRTCADGVFSSFSGSYSKLSCSVVAAPLQSCGSVASGDSQTRIRFQAASVTAPATCLSETQVRTCNNGSFSAYSGSFSNLACSIIQPPVQDLSRFSDSTFKNFDMPSVQTGSFEAKFNVTPLANNIDSVASLSAMAATGYADMAVTVRMNASGQFDARDGSNYLADRVINYEANKIYQIRMEIHLASRRYSVFVKPEGAAELSLANDIAFRTQQSSVSSLSKVSIRAYIGSHENGEVTIKSISAPAPLACGSTPNGGTVSRVRFQSDLPPAGQSCISQTQTATCNNGVLSSFSGSYTYVSCEATQVLPQSCGTLAHGESESSTAYTKATVPFGQTCQQIAVTKTCNDGSLTSIPSNTFDSCQVEPDPNNVGQCSSIKRNIFTWTFDKSYPCGKYANGDYWVVGPVNITSISPKSETKSNGRIVNGSVINPNGGQWVSQGFDSHMGGWTDSNAKYVASLNVGRNVSASSILKVNNGSSLISTFSHIALNANGQPDPSVFQRPTIADLAILTVVSSAPANGSFRPPYAGTDKTHHWNKSNLNYNILRKFNLSGGPSPDSMAGTFEKGWFELDTSEMGRNYHPKNHGQNEYGAYFNEVLGNAMLSLHLNYTDAQKETLYIRLVQYGIDIYGVAKTGGNWYAAGGFNAGRKPALVLAAVALNDTNIKKYANAQSAQGWIFHEDFQTFYVTQGDIGQWVDNSDGRGRVPYQQSDLGLAEWGEQHAGGRQRDSREWGAYYRSMNYIGQFGTSLAIRFLDGGTQAWNWPAYFDYMDRAWAIAPGDMPGLPASMASQFRSTAGPTYTRKW